MVESPLSQSIGSVQLVDAREVPDAVRRAVVEFRSQSTEPFAPALLLTPNDQARRRLTRALASRGAMLNVRSVVPHVLAKELLGQAHGSRALTATVRRELVRRVAREARGPLVQQPAVSLVPALGRAFEDLRQRSDGEVDLLSDGGDLVAEVVRLFFEFRRLVEAGGFADDRTLLEDAAIAVGERSPFLVAVVAEVPSAHQSHLFDVLAAVGRLAVVGVLSGHEPADSGLRTALWGLGVRACDRGAVAKPTPDRIVVAPDAEGEVTAALDVLAERAGSGVPLHDMAVLYPTAVPYRRIVQERARMHGMAVSTSSGDRAIQTPTGAFLSALLHARVTGWSFVAVSSLLHTVPLHTDDEEMRLPVHEWLKVVRSQRVNRGRDHWWKMVPEPPTADDGRVLGEFQSWLNTVSSREPVEHTWQGWVDWVAQLAKYAPAAVREGCDRLLRQLLVLDELNAETQLVDFDTFASAVNDELHVAVRQRTDAAGFFAGTLEEARGSRFSAVVICGLAEGALPGRPVDNSLVGALFVPGEELRNDELRRDLFIAMSGADHVVLTTPMADQRSQRESRPSPWLTELATERAGHLVTASELLRPGAYDWVSVIPSYMQLAIGSSCPSDRVRERLQALAQGADASQLKGLAHAMTVMAARDGESFTAFDGLVESGLLSEMAGATSATTLESWATCPRRYFFERRLGISPPRDEDDDSVLPADLRGLLVHNVLERFIKSVPQRLRPEHEWTPAEGALLHAIADKEIERLAPSGVVPVGLLGEFSRAQLHQWLADFLLDDVKLRAALGVVPSVEGTEAAFGYDDTGVEVQRSAGGRPIRLRGRIDRVDRAVDDSRIVAIDYKTGSKERYRVNQDDPVQAGRQLQAAVYAEALRSRHPTSDVRALYWTLKDRAQSPATTFPWDGDVRDRALETIGQIADGIDAGVFPAVPGDEDRGSWRNCRHCPFDHVCESNRDEVWNRKQHASSVQAFVTLGATSTGRAAEAEQ